jgi:hypothetical protein
MGYSIYYNRAFIRVGDQYIPLVSSGASNGAERVGGRWVAEKDWGVLNWKRRDRVLFSESEIREIAKDYERHNQESGMCYKSRNKPFGSGEFENWIVGGMKRARTIEEYRSVGNVINVVDYPNGMTERWRRRAFSTDEELLNLIKQFNAGQEFDIMFGSREITRPTAPKTQGRSSAAVGSSAPFAAIFGVTGAVPAASRPESEKPSVLGRIAEAREEQRKAKTGGCDNPAPGRKKTQTPEL